MDSDNKLTAGSKTGVLSEERIIYYRNGFFLMQKVVVLLTALVFLFVLLFAYYMNTHQRQDHFFAETVGGNKMQMVGLHYPNMGRTAMETWLLQAVTQIMTFGFNDIDERFALSRKNFTKAGWELFYQAMIDTKLAAKIIESQQILTTVPSEPPIIQKEGLIGDKYSWSYQVPLLLTVRSGGTQRSSTKRLYVVIEKIPTSENPAGVGIAEWYLY